MSWLMNTIGDVCEVLPGFAFKSKDLGDLGIPVIKIGNITESHSVNIESAQCLPENLLEKRHKKFLLQNGDILIAMTGATAGKVGRVRCAEDRVLLLNQRVAKLCPVSINPDYFWSAISTDRYRKVFFGLGGGAAQPNMSGAQIEAVEIPCPPLAQQEGIASILSAYDDLIENNRRRIQLLESAARLLYKEWFVHLRFPGHEHTRIVDGVPEGWNAGTIGDVGEVITGKTPSKKKPENFGSDLPFIKTPDMHGTAIVVHSEESLSEEGAKIQANKTLPPRSILVSCIGTVGAVALNASPAQTNQQINSIVPASDFIIYWAYFMAKALKPLLEGMGGGATMANVNKSKFSGIKVVIPSKQLLNLFSDFAKPVFDKIVNLTISNAQLAKARDLLLPKLMNGEVAV